MYIVFEGTVGTGKSTQSRLLFDFLKKNNSNREVVLTREPGGSEIADSIRKLVQGSKFEEKMDYVAEAYLYAASRAQTIRNVVSPVLEKKGIVISDRSFISSLAYQGVGRSLGIDKVMEINKTAVSVMPDIIIYMDLDPKVGLSRTFDKDGDKFEKKDVDFFTKIRQTYLDISKSGLISGKWISIDATGTKEEVFAKIRRSLEPYFL
jgi:dTMP kinase